MSVVDGELPFTLVDFIFAGIQTIMGAIFMCISAGYFTLTMPVVGIAVWCTHTLPLPYMIID